MGCTVESASIGSALDDAVEGLPERAKSGHASCKELEKRLSKNVRAGRSKRWEAR